ncbi:hypothetical protein M9980_07915 [Sphingomonas donggukensis]|uniref:UrcA family protein n=1 Tax=Sphingomonas donggukensis TaxID=2949093 RepID=A0ABY4TQ52_9SPHN|nr:hypothetical protein [Sphingomonas donggukensis]URW74510.1 hypothetical protein M9980_07915 [Sphingomonas donggukensis]
MILAALLMMQAAPAATEAAMATRLDQRWRGSLKGGACVTKRSTGDVDVDRIGCSAMETCQPQFDSRLQAAGDRAIPAGTKKVMRAALTAELAKCVTDARRAGIAALSAQRGAAL